MVLNRKLANSLMLRTLSVSDGSSAHGLSVGEQAFGELVALVQDELFRLSLANGLSSDEAKEATQEAFLRAYRGRGNWAVDSDAVSWLCGITMNVVRERRRQRRREGQSVAWWEDGSTSWDDVVDETAKDFSLWGPDEVRQLHDAISHLPDRQREAISCRFLRGLNVRETAEIMGCAEGTVKSAVFAALESLRKTLIQLGR